VSRVSMSSLRHLTPHPSPISHRLPDLPNDYPPLNGRGLSSRPIKGGFLQCGKKRFRPKYQSVGHGSILSDRMLASVRIPGVSTRHLAEADSLMGVVGLSNPASILECRIGASPFCSAIPADSE
jgi:hypothetical protein